MHRKFLLKIMQLPLSKKAVIYIQKLYLAGYTTYIYIYKHSLYKLDFMTYTNLGLILTLI